jgi:hypothetical protein
LAIGISAFASLTKPRSVGVSATGGCTGASLGLRGGGVRPLVPRIDGADWQPAKSATTAHASAALTRAVKKDLRTNSARARELFKKLDCIITLPNQIETPCYFAL